MWGDEIESQASAAKPSAIVPGKVVAASVAGNAFEFYDFLAYAFFAVYIGKTFFPASTDFVSLLLSVAVFGVGFVTRPFGGMLIGAYADRAGRRPAMLLTIALITIGTLGLALTPSYESIGVAAPILVVLCRLIQGVALGGEVGPASSYLIESAPPGKRGFYGSWQLASQGAAGFAAGLIGMIMASNLAPAEMQAWGWRVPFPLAVALVPIGLYLRKAMPESLHARPVAATGSDAKIGDHAGLIFLSVLAVIGGTVSTYLGLYMPTFAITQLKFAPTVALAAAVVGGISTFVFSLLSGWLCDRYGRRPIMLWPRIAAAVVSYPAFTWMIGQNSPTALYAVTFLLNGLTALSGAASLIAIPELFPARIRALSMSIAYAFGVAIFGGTTQFVFTWLLGATGNPASPAYYVTLTSIVAAIGMWFLPESRDRKI